MYLYVYIYVICVYVCSEKTHPVKELPTISAISPWDGQDAVLQQEEVSLADIMND